MTSKADYDIERIGLALIKKAIRNLPLEERLSGLTPEERLLAPTPKEEEELFLALKERVSSHYDKGTLLGLEARRKKGNKQEFRV